MTPYGFVNPSPEGAMNLFCSMCTAKSADTRAVRSCSTLSLLYHQLLSTKPYNAIIQLKSICGFVGNLHSLFLSYVSDPA